ncbi:hypothetical protein ACFL2V_10735 [Pseudomonadota bacterium]
MADKVTYAAQFVRRLREGLKFDQQQFDRLAQKKAWPRRPKSGG